MHGVGEMLQTQRTPPRKAQTVRYCSNWRVNISVKCKIIGKWKWTYVYSLQYRTSLT